MCSSMDSKLTRIHLSLFAVSSSIAFHRFFDWRLPGHSVLSVIYEAAQKVSYEIPIPVFQMLCVLPCTQEI